MATKAQTKKRDEARAELRKLLRPGMTVYTVLRHCSASGMLRVIDAAVTVPGRERVYPLAASPDYEGQRDYTAKPKVRRTAPEIRNIGYLAAKACGYTWDRARQGVKMGGCGMDMGFDLVYNLGHAVWPKGTRKPHGRRNGQPDSDGGYALRHAWL